MIHMVNTIKAVRKNMVTGIRLPIFLRDLVQLLDSNEMNIVDEDEDQAETIDDASGPGRSDGKQLQRMLHPQGSSCSWADLAALRAAHPGRKLLRHVSSSTSSSQMKDEPNDEAEMETQVFFFEKKRRIY